MKREILITMFVLMLLGLSACQRKSAVVGSFDENAYCREHPTACVAHTLNSEVQP